MKKGFTFFVSLLLFISTAAAYDFRQIIFGNDFQKIKEITEKTEIAKLNEEFEPLIEYYNYENNYSTNHGGMHPLYLDFYKIFKESYSNGTIYRIFRYDVDDPFRWYLNGGTKDDNYLTGLYQFVIFKNKKMTKCLGVYQIFNYVSDGGMDANGEGHDYKNFSIISKDSAIKAFLLTSITDSEVDFFREERKEVTQKTEGYWLDFDDNFFEYPEHIDFEKDKVTYLIEASFPLIDKDRPFMYTLQNAFDSNKKTSFVENTKDNMLILKITDAAGNGLQCKSVKLINGYASSENLYRTNNRIRKINSGKDKSFECEDNNLEFQTAGWDYSQLNVESLYAGEKCNDTCLAEINFLIADATRQEFWLYQY